MTRVRCLVAGLLALLVLDASAQNVPDDTRNPLL